VIGSINRQGKYVVLDVETTGLSPWKGDRVIEIGAVALEGGDLMAEFSTLIQAPRAIPFCASQIHGITDEMLIGQPTPEEVFPALEAFIRDSVLVAHNAQFDIAFLRREYELLGTRFPHRHICTLEMSRSRFPRLRNHKLETVYRHLIGTNGINGEGGLMRRGHDIGLQGGHDWISVGNPDRVPRRGKQTHRALDDARMVAAVWLAMGGR
jgi:DNA polymerase-3 subunit epsilon